MLWSSERRSGEDTRIPVDHYGFGGSTAWSSTGYSKDPDTGALVIPKSRPLSIDSHFEDLSSSEEPRSTCQTRNEETERFNGCEFDHLLAKILLTARSWKMTAFWNPIARSLLSLVVRILTMLNIQIFDCDCPLRTACTSYGRISPPSYQRRDHDQVEPQIRWGQIYLEGWSCGSNTYCQSWRPWSTLEELTDHRVKIPRCDK